MKYITLFCTIFIFSSCNNISKKQNEKTTADLNSVQQIDIKNKSFEEIFQPIDSVDYRTRLSQLSIQEDHTVITAGTDSLFNSMAARWEALGLYFESPTTLNLLGANRYTLEFMKKQQSYTLSFLPGQYQGELYAFGSKSGRNSNKMQETKLNYIKTPSGNITYREAAVVIECQLFEITTVQPNDYYTKEGRDFTEKGYEDANDYHKLVFGKVNKMWIKKGVFKNTTKQKETSEVQSDANTGATYLAASYSSNGKNEQIKTMHTKTYTNIFIVLITLAAYYLSFLLLKKKYITRLTHRKIWNIILFLAFIVSGLLGLFLVFQINFHFTTSLFQMLQSVHIFFGIVMAIVAIFHSFWHLNYFKKNTQKVQISKSA